MRIAKDDGGSKWLGRRIIGSVVLVDSGGISATRLQDIEGRRLGHWRVEPPICFLRGSHADASKLTPMVQAGTGLPDRVLGVAHCR
jgi:hypothetical protein